MSKTPEILIPALRQYRHNTDNSVGLLSPEQGFVSGFDYELTCDVVEKLLLQSEMLRVAYVKIRKELDDANGVIR